MNQRHPDRPQSFSRRSFLGTALCTLGSAPLVQSLIGRPSLAADPDALRPANRPNSRSPA